ncbi:MAG: cupin domain-containing protein [Acidobacteria bacterium]|nr:cupin domain-containing protein [Acidobacteriota bacterium]
MPLSRRNLAALLPALASGQTKQAPPKLPSKTYRFEDLVVKQNAQNIGRAVMNGATHTGYPIDMHITELAPGKMPHDAHKHAHEEMLCIFEGTLDVTIEGNTSRLGPGSSAFVASNEMHGWKNVGDTRARYFVFAFGRGQ